MGPSRLRAVLDRWPNPSAALAAVKDGRACDELRPDALLFGPHGRHELSRRWARAAQQLDLAPELARRGTTVLLDGGDDYPISDEVPDRPAVLLLEGSAPDVLGRPRVAIVGTRSATVHGLADAQELGAFLARCGVTVVSGMAIGIDGAAHAGALDAGGGVVGVVATGLDIVYPRRHVVLFERVRAAGVLLSETGFGIGANRFRFPVRNRIIAALADIRKRECAGGLVARLLGAVHDSHCDLRLARADGAFLKVLVTRVETPADQGERASVTTAGYPGVAACHGPEKDLRPTANSPVMT